MLFSILLFPAFQREALVSYSQVVEGAVLWCLGFQDIKTFGAHTHTHTRRKKYKLHKLDVLLFGGTCELAAVDCQLKQKLPRCSVMMSRCSFGSNLCKCLHNSKLLSSSILLVSIQSKICEFYLNGKPSWQTDKAMAEEARKEPSLHHFTFV